ncbi:MULTISPECIES: hypothetical protein [Streptomyces]|uniref:hypothetical protein n=1 Tax=Streptomyces TaxID=1883 RepID=UPI00345B98E7
MQPVFGPLPDDLRLALELFDTARALRDRRGEWALVQQHTKLSLASNQAHRIRTGKLVAFRPAGAFEAKARKNRDKDTGESDVWARYVGLPPAQAA